MKLFIFTIIFFNFTSFCITMIDGDAKVVTNENRQEKSIDDEEMEKLLFIDKSDWVDPHDFDYQDTKIRNDKKIDNGDLVDKDIEECKKYDKNIYQKCDNSSLLECQEELNLMKKHQEENYCDSRISAFTIRLIKKIVIKLNNLKKEQQESFNVISNVPVLSINKMESFMEKQLKNCNYVEEFENSIIDIINNISFYSIDNFLLGQEKQTNWLLIKDWSFLLFNILAVFTSIIIFVWVYNMSNTSRLIFFIFTTFVGLVLYEWMLLYYEEIVKNYAKIKHASPECVIGERVNDNHFMAAIYFVKNMFSDSLEKKCKDYYQATWINPIYKVHPLMALSSIITKISLLPLPMLGESLGHFFNNLFTNMPWYLRIIMSITIPFMFILAIFLIFGYSIKISSFLLGSFSIERTPTITNAAIATSAAHTTPIATNSSQVLSIENTNERRVIHQRNILETLRRTQSLPRLNEY